MSQSGYIRQLLREVLENLHDLSDEDIEEAFNTLSEELNKRSL